MPAQDAADAHDGDGGGLGGLHGVVLRADGRPSWGGQLSEHLFSFLNDCKVNKKPPLFHNKDGRLIKSKTE
ncbi:MAG: hypothetical protein IIW53_07010 [Rikenellaceae bacterium]|nr:hypothetical protein [Rikenellaceae bacterium]